MRQSAVYAAFPLREGLGLMCLEAMASGCLVVGYTGQGGMEYATMYNGHWIEEGYHENFVKALAEAYIERDPSRPIPASKPASKPRAAIPSKISKPNSRKLTWSLMGTRAFSTSGRSRWPGRKNRVWRQLDALMTRPERSAIGKTGHSRRPPETVTPDPTRTWEPDS